jgi:hypothetical protein
VAVGLKSRTRKADKKSKRRKSASPVQELPPWEATPTESTTKAPHVVGKPAEREPDENEYRPHEAPEAAAQGPEAPDAGYGRCTESSDFANRGRNWS